MISRGLILDGRALHGCECDSITKGPQDSHLLKHSREVIKICQGKACIVPKSHMPCRACMQAQQPEVPNHRTQHAQMSAETLLTLFQNPAAEGNWLVFSTLSVHPWVLLKPSCTMYSGMPHGAYAKNTPRCRRPKPNKVICRPHRCRACSGLQRLHGQRCQCHATVHGHMAL